MFRRLLHDVGESTGIALRLTSLAVAAAMALFVTTSFLCAAAFVFVLNTYGLVQACLAGAAVFSVVALITAGCYVARKKQIERDAAAAKSSMQTVLADPVLLSAGIQLVRVVGVKRLIPILAVGGLALGLLARSNGVRDQAPAE